MLTENELQKLLRLKRHEIPPPGYFERFLAEFHRNQRRDLIHTPLHVIWRDRVAGFFSSFEVPRTVYVGTMGAFAMIALGMGYFWDHSAPQPPSPSRERGPALSLASQTTVYLPAERGQQPPKGRSFPTRYVLDSHPVSYEPPFGF